MANDQPAISTSFLTQFFSRLRFPELFVIFAILFGIDMIVPDLVPFVDELILGLLTLMMGSFRRRRDQGVPGAGPPEKAAKPPEKNVTPKESP
jgi:hypothetical protein